MTTPTQRYAQYVADTATAQDTTARGLVLNEYLQDVFARIDGVKVDSVECWSDDESQEVDILLWNEKVSGSEGLSFLPSIVFVEAKNWERSVGSPEVAWFKEKVRTGGDYSEGGAVGILVAPNGVTGTTKDRTFATSIILKARSDNVRLLVVTPEELAVEAAGLRELVRSRLCGLAADRAGLPE